MTNLQRQIANETKLKQLSIEKQMDNYEENDILLHQRDFQKVFNSARVEWLDWMNNHLESQSTARRKSQIFHLINKFKAVYDEKTDKSYITEPCDLLITLILYHSMQNIFNNNGAVLTTVAEEVRIGLYRSYSLEVPQNNTDNETLKHLIFFIRGMLAECGVLKVVASRDVEKDSMEALMNVHPDQVMIILCPTWCKQQNINAESMGEFRKSLLNYKPTNEPMLVKPRPHTSLKDGKGGYLTYYSPLLRKDPRHSEHESFKHFNSDNYPNYFNTLNALQEQPWVMNTALLDFLPTLDQDLIPWVKMGVEEAKETKKRIGHEVFPALEPFIEKSRENKNKLAKLIEGIPRDEQDVELIKALREDNKQLSVYINGFTKEYKEMSSVIGKAYAKERLETVIDKYRDEECFYLPVAKGSNGRTYYYPSGLNFQGDNYMKALIHSAKKETMNEEGFKALCVALGTMFKGMDKKVNKARQKAVEDAHEAIMNFVSGKDHNTFLDLIDYDEFFTAVSLAIEYYNHKTINNYQTGVILYIDATSSAIQINGLLQHCVECCKLTNLAEHLNGDSESLPDAYMSVSDGLRQDLEVVSQLNNNHLAVFLMEAWEK